MLMKLAENPNELWDEKRIFTRIAELDTLSDDPYDTLEATGRVVREMHDEYEAERARLMEQPKYSRYNGETVSFPDEEGTFWVEHANGKFIAKEFFISSLTKELTCFDSSYLPKEFRIYGPIPYPITGE